METTCGLIILNSDLSAILVGHPTNAPMNAWSIPKGLGEKDELPLDTALRELHEEFGLDLSAYRDACRHIGEYTYMHRGKKLVAFGIVMSKPIACEYKCTSTFTMLGSKEMPEIDVHCWMSLNLALKYLHHTAQEALRDFLQALQK